ncbi:hypothetical protein LTS12_028065 [Elasticomyces elasticus]|nr:hypothetical protein LTS12_028065 [Elasticomyces elasticus]
MAKAKAQSRHSRAARRDVSPSVDVDKSLRSAPRAESTVIQRESVLSERANSGVTKKQPKAKALSKAQRQRQQKGMEKAEMVVDQLEKKVDRSLTRGKSVKARRADWEDLNRKNAKLEALRQLAEGDDPDDSMADVSAASKSTKPESQPTTQNPVAEDHAGADEDEEIT